MKLFICIISLLTLITFKTYSLNHEEEISKSFDMVSADSTTEQSYPIQSNIINENEPVKTNPISFNSFNIFAGLGLSGNNSHLIEDTKLSFIIGFRYLNLFLANGKIGFLTDLWIDSNGHNDSTYNNSNSSRHYLNISLAIAGKYEGFFIALGAFYGYMISSDSENFYDYQILKKSRNDYGLMFDIGYSFDKENISIGIKLKAGFATVYKLSNTSYWGNSYYDDVKNTSLNFYLTYNFSNFSTWSKNDKKREKYEKWKNEAEETEKRNKYRKQWLEKLSINDKNIVISPTRFGLEVSGNYFSGPSFTIYYVQGNNEIKSIKLDFDDMKVLLKELDIDNYSLKQSERYYNHWQNWLWSWFFIGPLCGIPCGIKMGESFHYAKKINQKLRDYAINNKEKFAKELSWIVYYKEMLDEEKQRENYSFIGIYFNGGMLIYDNKSGHYSPLANTVSNLNVGFRITYLMAYKGQSHLKIGFALDLVLGLRDLKYDSKGDSTPLAKYLEMNAMFAIKYKVLFLGLGFNVGIKLKSDSNEEINKITNYAPLAEFGFFIIDSKEFKLMIGMQFKYYLNKVNYYDRSKYSWSGSQIYKTRPYALYGTLNLGF